MLDLAALLNHIQQQWHSGGNILIRVPPQMLPKLRVLLKLHAVQHQHELLSIDASDDLQPAQREVVSQGNAWLIKPSAGRLQDYSARMQHKGTLLIDWSEFTPAQATATNAVLETTIPRRAGLFTLPRGTTVIGLISSEAEILGCDPAFTARQQDTRLETTEAELDQALAKHLQLNAASSSSAANTLELSLYNSPNWRLLLFGRCTFEHGEPKWQVGLLPTTIKQRTLRIINGPWHDTQFKKTIDDLSAGLPVYFRGKIFRAQQPLEIAQQDNYDFSQFVDTVKTVNIWNEAWHTHIGVQYELVNASNIDYCFSREDYAEGGHIQPEQGWLARHPEPSVYLLISGELSIPQLYALCAEAHRLHKTLHCFVTDKSVIPEKVLDELGITLPRVPVSEESGLSTQTIRGGIYQHANPTLLVDVMLVTWRLHEPLQLDASELSASDLLYKKSQVYDREHNRFICKLSYSAVYQHLRAGKDVILTGEISESVLNHLTSLLTPHPFVYENGRKVAVSGRLFLCLNEVKPRLGALAHQQSVDVSIGALPTGTLQAILDRAHTPGLYQTWIDEDSASIREAAAAHEPWVSIKQQLRQKQHLSIAQVQLARSSGLPIEHSVAVDDLSPKAADAFFAARLQGVKQSLAASPIIFVEGEPACGKSAFIRECEARQLLPIYRQKQIVAWASNPDGGLLAIDEARSAKTHWTQFLGLMNLTKGILIDGVYYPLTDNHQVIFFDNKLADGGERASQQLFTLWAHQINFPRLTPAAILQRILKPIAAFSAPGQAVTTASHRQMASLPVRELQTAALAKVADTYVLAPYPALPVTDYVATESRGPVVSKIQRLLKIRRLRRHLMHRTQSQDRVTLQGGINALFLYGESREGKSTLIKATLAKAGYRELSVNELANAHARQPQNFEQCFVCLPATALSDDAQNPELLTLCFQKGIITVVDEFDSIKIDEPRINAYLMGEDLDGKPPEALGFMMLTSANGAKCFGRNVASIPQLDRAEIVELTDYTLEEYVAILRHNFPQIEVGLLHTVTADFILSKQQADRQAKMQRPTLAHLLSTVGELAKSQVEAELITVTTLTDVYNADPSREILADVLLLVEETTSTPLMMALSAGDEKKALNLLPKLSPQVAARTLFKSFQDLRARLTPDEQHTLIAPLQKDDMNLSQYIFRYCDYKRSLTASSSRRSDYAAVVIWEERPGQPSTSVGHTTDLSTSNRM